VLGAIIAFVATLAGASLAEWSSRSRERRVQKLEWNRRLFDKYADAYRDFLATWGGAANTVMLETSFAELRSKALVPGSVVKEYEKTVAGLQGHGPERETYAVRLKELIEEMLNDPLGLITR
jgi:hypothetical protein